MRFLTVGGSPVSILVTYAKHVWREESQSDYGVYEAHIDYEVEYPLIRVQSATQVGAAIPSITATDAYGGTHSLSEVIP